MSDRTPPAGFVRSLQLMDSLLSVRWGPKVGKWVIERKAFVPVSEIEFLRKRKARAKAFFNHPPANATSAQKQQQGALWEELSEELASARMGKRPIMFTKVLSPEIYNALAAADIRRYGGYARYADALEAGEERAEAEAERILSNKRNAYNKEVYDMLNFIWKKREDSLINGERDMRKLLHDKKTQPDDEPLLSLTDM